VKLDHVLNFADVNIKRRFLAMVGALTAPHEVTMKPYKPRRSNAANRYYFGTVVKAFVQFNEEQGQPVTPELAHSWIAQANHGRIEILNPLTGAVVMITHKETKHLSTEQFAAYIEKAWAWVSDFGIEIETFDEFKNMEKQCHRSIA
jgi:hypothetical protein